MKESSFDKKKEKYNLEPKLFESYHLTLQAKTKRCYLKSILDIVNTDGKLIHLVTQHTLLMAAEVMASADAT